MPSPRGGGEPAPIQRLQLASLALPVAPPSAPQQSVPKATPIPSLLPLVPVLLVATLVQSTVAFALTAPAALGPVFCRVVDASSSCVGYYLSVAYLGAAISSLVAGCAVRRLGACCVLCASATVGAIGCLLMALQSHDLCYLAMLCLGLAYGASNPPGAELLMRTAVRRHRNLIFSLRQAGAPMGGALAGIVAPRVSSAVGFAPAFVLVSLALATAALVPLLLRRHWDRRDAQKTSGLGGALGALARGMLPRNHALRRLGLYAFLMTSVQLSLVAYTVTLAIDGLGYTAVAAGGVLSLLQLAAITGRVGWGWLGDTFGRSHIWLMTTAVIASAGVAGMPLLVQVGGPFWVGGLAVLLGLSAIGWNGLLSAQVASCAPPGRASEAMGACLVYTYSGVLCGPALFATLAAWSNGYALSLVGMSALGLLAAFLVRRPLSSGGMTADLDSEQSGIRYVKSGRGDPEGISREDGSKDGPEDTALLADTPTRSRLLHSHHQYGEHAPMHTELSESDFAA